MPKSYQIDWGVYQSHLISLDDEMRHANYESYRYGVHE